MHIGKGTKIFDPKNIQIDISRPELLEIGEHVFLHRGTTIQTHDWASWCFVYSHNDFLPSHGRVKIGNNVWLGENVTILKGVTIGDNVIIGIGSIVTKSIPSNSIAVGCPAKVIGTYEDYYKKRKEQSYEEMIDYGKAILEQGKTLKETDFYNDYPIFTDAHNYKEYPYPYERIFNQRQFEAWKKQHQAPFKEFKQYCMTELNINKSK